MAGPSRASGKSPHCSELVLILDQQLIQDMLKKKKVQDIDSLFFGAGLTLTKLKQVKTCL